MEYTKRYQQFLRLGGGKNYEYMEFITKMKNLYFSSGLEKGPSIYNHDQFTDFIEKKVDSIIKNV